MAATAATASAYGSCVRTWSIWSEADPIDERIVVSEIGEQWSPNTAPLMTEDIVAIMSASYPAAPGSATAASIGQAMGNTMPMVPYEVPVEKEIVHETR